MSPFLGLGDHWVIMRSPFDPPMIGKSRCFAVWAHVEWGCWLGVRVASGRPVRLGRRLVAGGVFRAGLGLVLRLGKVR